jgi:hypothetical protein
MPRMASPCVVNHAALHLNLAWSAMRRDIVVGCSESSDMFGWQEMERLLH